jgi:hypothetical protein
MGKHLVFAKTAFIVAGSLIAKIHHESTARLASESES